MGLLDGLVTGLARASKFGRSHSLRPLTSKRANRRFYKGNGCRNEGVHGKRGRYIVDKDKLLSLEVPDLSGFKVRTRGPVMDLWMDLWMDSGGSPVVDAVVCAA
jgi:hypothetical protein